MKLVPTLAPLLLVIGSLAAAAPGDRKPPMEIAPYFQPPAALAHDLGGFRSPLLFRDGKRAANPADWQRRRKEILAEWHAPMGAWPPLLPKPDAELLERKHVETYTQQKLRLETAPGQKTDGYLLTPDGNGPFPAVLVVFYEADTAIGGGKPLLDFARQLTRRGFVTLSLGTPGATFYPPHQFASVQPLSFHAYVAANCYQYLATLPNVDPQRIGVTGHSYGGKWAMFASCLFEKFACAAWSDPGIVFDEKRSNVNYWEPWYLGFDPATARKAGIPSDENPRTGPYKKMIETGHDLVELHALMAPRPFLVSGGSEDTEERWKALNHAIAVNELLGYHNRVAMTLRPAHTPTPESNEVLCRFFEHFLGKMVPFGK